MTQVTSGLKSWGNRKSAGFVNRNVILGLLLRELETVSTQPVFDQAYLNLWLQSVRHQVGESRMDTEAYRCKDLNREEKYEWYNRVNEWIIDQQLVTTVASSI